MSAEDEALQKMVALFRVQELHSLLMFAKINRYGKKSILQSRAINLIKLGNSSINMKIRELYYNHNNIYPGEVETMNKYQLDKLTSNLTNSSSQSPVISSASEYRGYTQHKTPPQYPGVFLKELPFFEFIHEFVRPTVISKKLHQGLHEREFRIYLTLQQIIDLHSNLNLRVQMRICKLDPTCEQEDKIPVGVSVRVNHRTIISNSTAAAEQKKIFREPIDLTLFLKKTASDPNYIQVITARQCITSFIIVINMVRKCSSFELTRQLNEKKIRIADHTKELIIKKIGQDGDLDIAATSLRISLLCPLGKVKMQLPCQSINCTHLQCFDASSFVQMNERISKWICPVCDKPAEYKDLVINGLFMDIITQVPSEVTEVEFNADGSWVSVMPKKTDDTKSTVKIESKELEIISLNSDESDVEDGLPNKKKCNSTSFTETNLVNQISQEWRYGCPDADAFQKDIPLNLSKTPLVVEEIKPDDNCIFGTPSISDLPHIATFNCVSTSKSFNENQFRLNAPSTDDTFDSFVIVSDSDSSSDSDTSLSVEERTMTPDLICID